MYTSLKEQYLDKLVQLEHTSMISIIPYRLLNITNTKKIAMHNEIYGVLKEQLSTSEMNVLRQKQREWTVYQDKEAVKGAEH